MVFIIGTSLQSLEPSLRIVSAALDSPDIAADSSVRQSILEVAAGNMCMIVAGGSCTKGMYIAKAGQLHAGIGSLNLPSGLNEYNRYINQVGLLN